MASLWVGMGMSCFTSSRPGTLWVRRPVDADALTQPLAKNLARPRLHENWYFREELPLR